MLAALGMREVGAIVLVDCQAESAFETSHMVFEEVRVFIEIDVFEGEFAKTFAPVCVRGGVRGDASASEFGANTVLNQRS